ncbi:DUF6630 family protein [Nocardia noduli]|uniref:DUF6630 family protein n=1 Tax=Nocardia noduli TaxID=2815722 RepID=UPI001C237B5A|nr:hypothetical protein [Nocardia noduli]
MPDTQQIPQALAEIVALIAPDSEPILRRMADAIAAVELADRAPTGALLDALYPDGGDLNEAGIVYCDWRSDPAEIRSYLIELPGCPASLNWDWVDDFDEDDWNPEEIESFLWPLAARCRDLATALIILDTGSDGYGLGFVRADHIDRIVELARTAHCDLRVVYPQVPTYLT